MTQDFVKFRVRAALAHSFLAFKFHDLISMPGPHLCSNTYCSISCNRLSLTNLRKLVAV